MTRTSRPIDGNARERLRKAQQEEATALREVAAAQQRHEKTRERFDTVVAREQATVDRAVERVIDAKRKLVASSGLERAATLLGDAPATLRRKLRRSTTRRAPKGESRSTP